MKQLDLLATLGEFAHTEQLAQAPAIAPGMGQVREEDQLARARATTNVLPLAPAPAPEADLPHTSEPTPGALDDLDASQIAALLHPNLPESP